MDVKQDTKDSKFEAEVDKYLSSLEDEAHQLKKKTWSLEESCEDLDLELGDLSKKLDSANVILFNFFKNNTFAGERNFIS